MTSRYQRGKLIRTISVNIYRKSQREATFRRLKMTEAEMPGVDRQNLQILLGIITILKSVRSTDVFGKNFSTFPKFKYILAGF